MKNLLSGTFLVILVACSPKEPSPVKPEAKQSSGLHEYSVTFAAVKVPDETLKQLALPPFESPHSPENDQKLAAYVVAHPGDFSITGITGNCLPMVLNNGETHAKLLLDPKKEEQDYESLGLMTKQLDVRVSVQDEDDHGRVLCNWFCMYSVHLREPVGNSTDQGGTGPCLGAMAALGQPYIGPLFHGKGVSLWMMGTISRNIN